MKHQYLTKALTLFLIGVLCSFQMLTVSAAPGDLDLTFNGTGISRIAFSPGADGGNAVFVQGDGKYLVAGFTFNNLLTKSDFSVVRYNSDGSFDASFGVGGKVSTSFSTTDDVANAVAVQADGRVIAAGTMGTVNSRFAVVRYNADGSLDDSFGIGGKVNTPVGVGASEGKAMAIQTDGRVIVAGTSFNGSNTDFAVVRYNTDGSLDSSFGVGGKVITPVASDDDSGNAVAIQQDGKIVVVGSAKIPASPCVPPFTATDPQLFAVVRYNTDGSLDTSFGGGDGKVFTQVSGVDIANGVTFQSSTTQGLKIVVAGFTQFIPGRCSDPDPGKIAVVRYNADGSLDFSFGGDGIVTTQAGVGGDVVNAVAIQTGIGAQPSRIVVAGYSSNGATRDFMVVKYLLDGSLDTAFDGDGVVTTPFGPADDEGNAMRVSAGKITVAGTSLSGSSLEGSGDFAVARYNLADGSLDSSLDGDGKKTDNLSNNRAVARDVAIQPDGKVVVVGFDDNGSESAFALARYNTDGSLDNSFGGDGKVTFIRAPDRIAFAVAVQIDGRVVVAGKQGNNYVLLRLNADGSVDNSFPSINIPTFANAADGDLAIQVDGKIVLAGSRSNSTGNDFFVFRFNTDGSRDSSFGDNGEVITPVGAGNDEGKAVAIQPDGKIVVAGTSFNGSNTDFAVVRYNTNGSLDAAFDLDGKVTTQVSSGFDSANAVAIQPNGRVVVAGNTPNDFVVVRYNTNGSLDSSFDGDGVAITPVGTSTGAANAVAIQTDGRVVAAGTSSSATIGLDFAVVRYNSDGSLDTSYSGDGKVLVNVSGLRDEGFGVALDSLGNAVVVGEAGGLLGVVRLLGSASGCDYQLSPTSDYLSDRGGTCSFNVITDSGCAWTAQTSASWLVIVSDPAGTGNGVVSLEVRDNFTSAARLGTVTAAGQTFTVVQDGRGTSCSHSVAPLFASFQVGGGTGSINLTTGAECGWQATSNQSWIVITSSEVGIGSVTINYSVAANTTGTVRDGAIMVGGQGFKVKQKGS